MSIIDIPALKTSLSDPLRQLEKHILDHHIEIEAWFRQKWQQNSSPIYGSVDLRNAGFKLSPVDMNLFPAGFNNLDNSCLPLTVQAMEEAIEQRHPQCRRILLIPENHTRNMFYLESLRCLQEILIYAGYEARIGSLMEQLTEVQKIDLPSGKTICLEPLQRQQDRILIGDFDPCLLLLNNDLSEGLPQILSDINQPIYPPTQLGWTNRLKSNYFAHYEQAAIEFANLIAIDPWLLIPKFRHCGKINFLKHEGEECLVHHSSELLAEIEKKYQEYSIKEQPFIVIKADAGTYGMGVMTIQDPSELLELNRKTRTKMATIKGNQKVSQVIIQEGVHALEFWQDHVAEPVVYLIGTKVVGGFYRIHQNKGPNDNLNAPGMHFQPLPFCDSCNMPDQNLTTETSRNRFYIYSVIARLSMLAANSEEKEALT